MQKRTLFRGIAALSSLLFLSAFAGCGSPKPERPGDDEPKITAGTEGWYVLTGKTVAGRNVTDNYVYNCMELKDGEVSWYEIDLTGKSVQSGTYAVDGNTVSVEIGIKTYEYTFDETALTMTFSGKLNRIAVEMVYQYDKNFSLPTASGGVAFTDELFGESKEEDFYNYCPSVIMEGNDVMHVWYCSNKVSGNVTDYVAYRKGTLNAEGKWEFTEKELVLGPADSASDWDGRHVCDPSVTKGEFTMGGEDYAYLMAYLGCKTSNNCANEVGIAVAKAPEGPWVKVESLNPIANFYTSSEYDATKWGYGQPCVISSDGAGKVLLFYTKGIATKTCTQVEEWDLSDLDNPVKVRASELREGGSVNASGVTDCIHNSDFAYDPATKRLYCLKEDFPYPTDGDVNWISGSNTLMYTELGESGFDVLFGESPYLWNVAGRLTSSATGAARNHNAGLVTDGYGRLTDSYKISALYTVSDLKTDHPDHGNYAYQWPALHTYRIHGYAFDVN